MLRNNCQKIKMLKLIELLKQETDEQHPMRASVICQRLAELGISCDRRTLTKDIAVFNNHGFEVMSIMIGHEKGYYIEDRSFSVPELKLLIDAVQAANFITDKKTLELIDKIAELGGSHRADILKSNMVRVNTRKHSNEAIYYNVGFLEDAIEQNKKVLFRYFDLDEHKNKVYRRNGHRYILEPIALVFHEDNYYLACYSAKHHGTANYRVDRMDAVEVINEPISPEALMLRDSISDYTEQAFKMYGSSPEEITFEFEDSLLGVLYDKFGEDIHMVRTDERHCVLTVKVQISPTFWGWLFQFGRQIKILAPQSVIDERTRQATLLLEP